MATRGAFLFEISPYPGRKGPVFAVHVYNHWGGDPREIVEIILEHWEEALDRLANDPSANPDVPQVSGAQVMMGLMLADVGFQFRLSDAASVGSTGFTYCFAQSTRSAHSLKMSIQAGDTTGKQIFNGGYPELKAFWEEELRGG